MYYSADAYLALVEEIEHQGGAQLPDPCLASDVEFTEPPYTTTKTLKAADGEGTCGCGHDSRFVTVYEPRADKLGSGEGFVTACAVCDSMGGWGRYSHIYADYPSNEKPWDN